MLSGPSLESARPANSPAVRAPSTQLAPPPAALPAHLEPEHPAHVPVLAHAPALEHLVPVASAALHVQVAHLRLPARPRARRVPHQEAVADARSSIPRPKKAR